jgi:hypothetical protein
VFLLRRPSGVAYLTLDMTITRLPVATVILIVRLRDAGGALDGVGVYHPRGLDGGARHGCTVAHMRISQPRQSEGRVTENYILLHYVQRGQWQQCSTHADKSSVPG